MSDRLTRAELQAQIEAFLAGKLAGKALEAWAFDRFCREEEGALDYEEGYEESIAAVLDDLMWGDSPPFTLDQEAARGLLRRIAEAQPAIE